MLGIILSSVVCFIGILLFFIPKKQSTLILYVLAIILLTYKMVEYTRYGLMLQLHKIPLEFSTMSYFIFSISVIFNLKTLRSIAAFSSFISGIGYLLTFPILYEQFFSHNGYYLTTLAFLNHSILFIGSLLLIKIHPFSKQDIKKVLFYTAVYTSYVIIVDYLVTFPQTFILIRLILGANILSYVLPYSNPSSIDYFVYFIFIIFIYRFVIHLFYWLNCIIEKLMKGASHEHTI